MTPDEPSSTAPVTPVLADSKFGYWVSLGTGFTTLLTSIIAVATPPLSGPWCKAGCFTYPYADIAARFPRDYLWMFSALLATLLFVAFVLALQARARPERRLIGQLGVVLSAMAALTLLGDYFVQLAVIQPSILAGEADGISLLTQYNPHGTFIALEELGYLLMAASLAAMALASPSSTHLERTVRSFFVGGLVLALAALAWFTVRYGHGRAYLFEVAIISIVWLTLIPTAFMMAAVFRRDLVTRRSGRGSL
jgi:hypothetical protein